MCADAGENKERLRIGRLWFRAEAGCAVPNAGRTCDRAAWRNGAPSCACRTTLSPLCASGGGQACDLAFDDRLLHASDACRLSGAIHGWNRRLLKVVYLHETVVDCASEQRGQFDIGYQMKAAGQIIARDALDFSGTGNDHAFEVCSP